MPARGKSRTQRFLSGLPGHDLLTDKLTDIKQLHGGAGQSLDMKNKKCLFFCQKENETWFYFSGAHTQYFMSCQFKGVSTRACLMPCVFAYTGLPSSKNNSRESNLYN